MLDSSKISPGVTQCMLNFCLWNFRASEVPSESLGIGCWAHVKAAESSMIESDNLCGLHGEGEGTPHQSSSSSMATKLERSRVDQWKQTGTIKSKATWLSIQTSEFTGVLGVVLCSWAQRGMAADNADPFMLALLLASPGSPPVPSCSWVPVLDPFHFCEKTLWTKATWGERLYHGREVKAVRA